jgi:hypothetical protein
MLRSESLAIPGAVLVPRGVETRLGHPSDTAVEASSKCLPSVEPITLEN